MIPAARLQPFDDRLHAEVMFLRGSDDAVGNDPAELRIRRDLPAQPPAPARFGQIAGPEHDRALPGLAARDIVGEAARREQLGDARKSERAEAERARLQQQAAVDHQKRTLACTPYILGWPPMKVGRPAASPVLPASRI